MVEEVVCSVGGPDPHQVRGPEEGGTLRGRAARAGPGFLRGGLYYQVQQKEKGLTGEHKSGKMEKTHTNQITKEAVL